MSTRYLFDETGRVRRADGAATKLLVLGALLLAALVGASWYRFVTYVNLSPLQRLYVYQFASSEVKHTFSPWKLGEYRLILRHLTKKGDSHPTAYLCNESELEINKDELGNVQVDEDGNLAVKILPFVQRDMGKNSFTYVAQSFPHAEAHRSLATNIYENNSFYSYLINPLIAALITFVGSVVAFRVARRRVNQQKLKGQHLRGSRLISASDYAKIYKQPDSIEIETV